MRQAAMDPKIVFDVCDLCGEQGCLVELLREDVVLACADCADTEHTREISK